MACGMWAGQLGRDESGEVLMAQSPQKSGAAPLQGGRADAC